MFLHNFRCQTASCFFVAIVFVFEGSATHGQPNAILQLRPDGPIARIHAMEFSADGKRLYAAGDEKQIQVWRVDNDKFQRVHGESLRQMIGPGPLGSIHAMSVSRDQRYIVAGGIGTFEDHAGFSSGGVMIPSVGWSEQTLAQLGTVSLFDTTNNTVQRIKTHAGYVLAAKIASSPDFASPYLITIGNDQKPTECGAPTRQAKVDRSLRIIRVPDGEILFRWPIPETKTPPNLCVWSIDNATDARGLRIAVSRYNGEASDGVDLFFPGSQQPKHLTEPYALAIDQISSRSELLVSSRQGLRIIDGESGQQKNQINLARQISSSEAIYSIDAIRDQPSLAAITTRSVAQRDSQFRLSLINIDQGSQSAGNVETNHIDLGNRQNPAVAVDPTGQFIAATADVAAGIQIFSVADLRQGNATPVQVLKPDFQPISRAALVTVDDAKILKIQTPERNGQRQSYEFGQNNLRPTDSNDWPSTGQLIRFNRTANPNEFVAISPSGQPSKLKIETASPPLGKQINSKLLDGRPLAAIAFMQFAGEAQVQLSLYDPATGIELRRLNGHQQFITGIEFSEDHEHLTSVSAEGMVCVWSLSDLGSLVGKRSTIRGIEWCMENGQPTVSSLDDRHAENSLQVGDKVLGIVDPDDNTRAAEFDSFEQFFRALSDLAPDGVPRLLVERDAKKWHVSVRLEQGTDERKPLFSFITLPNENANALDWLVWTPSGPFQSSGHPIEQRAGWHFNPDGENDNAKFAPLAQYRDDFYGQDLVDALVAIDGIPAVWPPETEAELAACMIDVDGQTIFDDAHQFQPAKPIVQLQVSVTGVPADSVSQVSVRLDEGDPIEITRSNYDPEIWLYDLSEPLQLESPHRIDVAAEGKRIRGGTATRAWDVAALQRPPEPDPPEPEPTEPTPPEPIELPEILITSHASYSELRAADMDQPMFVSLEAMIDAESIPEDVEIVGVQNDAEVPLTDVLRAGNGVKASIPLVLGPNRLALRLRLGQSTVTSTPVMIDVVDPPTINWIAGRTEKKNIEKQNIGRVQLGIRSSKKPDESNLQLAIEGVLRDQYDVAIEDPSPESPNLFPVILTNISLSAGRNRIDVRVLDDAGLVTSQKQLVLIGKQQPTQPKLDLFLSEGAVFESSELGFTVAVTSDDLQELTWHVGDKQQAIAIDPDQMGRRLVDVVVPLEVGINSVVLTAVSKSGLTTTETRSITRLQPPVELTIHQFTADGIDPIGLEVGDDSMYLSKIPVPVARGSMTGTVRVSDAVDKELESQVVRAWVNGFLQSIVTLQPTGQPGELSFSIPVMLSLPDNEVRLDLPGLVEGEDTAVKATLLCEKPSSDQTLHLLIVSTRVEGKLRREYEKQVLDLLGIENGRMPAFNKVISGTPDYPALAGTQVRSDQFRPLIRQCRFRLAKEQASNNAVLIYFHGVELVDSDGRFCLMTSDATAERAFDDRNLITSTYLGERFRGLKCANLLFLDVTQHAKSAPLQKNGDPSQEHLGVLRMSQQTARSDPADLSLLSQLEKVIPRVGELGQVAAELRDQLNAAQGIVISENFQPPIRRVPFGERVAN